MLSAKQNECELIQNTVLQCVPGTSLLTCPIMNQHQPGVPHFTQNTNKHLHDGVAQPEGSQHVHHIGRTSYTPVQELGRRRESDDKEREN